MRSDYLTTPYLPMGLAAALLIAAPAAAASSRPERTDPATLKATGEPVRCIPRNNVTTIPAGDKYLMFRVSSNRWYRNELRNGCPNLRSDRAMVFRNVQGSQFCDMDIFDSVDAVSRMNFGACSLGQFTPVEVPKGTRF